MPAPTTPTAAGNGTPSTPSALQSSFVRNTFTLSDGKPREFLWSCELSKDKPEITWPLNEADDDDDGDDLDFIDHTLFVRNAVLGVNATMDERCVVQVETKDYAQKQMKVPIASLTLGKTDMCHLDLNFSHEIPVTFRLIEGTGPICLTGQHLAEVPPNPSTEDEDDDIDTSCTEGDTTAETEEDTDTSVTDKEKPKKRKGSNISNKKSKRGKTDSAASTATEDDDEDEDEDEDAEAEAEEDDDEEEEEEESMEEEEEEEEEVSPKKKTKGGKAIKKQPTAKELKAKMKATGGKAKRKASAK